MSDQEISTGLRPSTLEWLESIDSADLIVGIPSFNNEDTIQHVMETVSRGVNLNFPNLETVIMLSDGGSLDLTRERAQSATLPPDIDRIASIYRGLPGKGSAFRAIFEAGSYLNAKACLVVDSDLRKWPPSWVKKHLDPILSGEADLMAPHYIRHKYDATITNNVCYPMVSMLYGYDIRQPIGGDFALSRELMNHYSRQDVWNTDVARFGIDIWMTTTALCEGFDVWQSNLGAKIHDPKDPGEALGPMFKEVVGTLFSLMKKYESKWRNVDSVEEITRYGEEETDQPKPVAVNRPGLAHKAADGWGTFRELWEKYLSDETFEHVQALFTAPGTSDGIGLMSTRLWTHILYDYSVAYNFSGDDTDTVIESLVPLYFARSYALFAEMDPLVDHEAETYIRELVSEYTDEKSYLLNVWPDDTE